MTTWTHSPNEVSGSWTKIGYPVDTNQTATGPISEASGAIAKDNAGSGYAVDDTFTIGGGDGTASGKVTHVFLGTVLTVVLVDRGNDYVRDISDVSTTTTSGSGSGLTIKIYWIDPYPLLTDWNTLYGGVWNLGSFVAWEDLDRKNWEDWT